MPDINEEYERKHRRHLLNVGRKIKKAYEDSISELTFTASLVKYKGQIFDLDKFPLLKNKIDLQANRMHASIYSTVVNSIEDSWDLSNLKNNVLIDKRLEGRLKGKPARAIFYDPNKDAMQAFISRKDKGLDLSKRVWKVTDQFKAEMERGLLLGISEGKGAKEMASDLKKFLNDPKKSFKRVRDAKGKLKLSAAAKEYHPGQGVYRSSYKNALRVTRSETNIAYRLADHERWMNLPFVVGFEIRLSAAHPKYDICDVLKGQYPKDFVWTGWHPQCMCHAVPVMVNDEDFEKMEDELLGIGDGPPDIKQIEHPPAAFGKYVNDNKDRIAGWKKKPYWVKDNSNYIKGANLIERKGKLTVDYSKLNLEPYIKRLQTPRYKGVLPELTIEEKASIHGYTDTEYYSLNSFLRGLNVSNLRAEYFNNYRNLLNNAIDEISVKYEGTAYRGTRLDTDALKVYKDALKSKDAITHDYFTSTSSDPSRQFDGNTRFIIHSKYGREVEVVSYHQHEKEVLFKAGSKFRVKKYEKRHDGVTYITLEEVD